MLFAYKRKSKMRNFQSGPAYPITVLIPLLSFNHYIGNKSCRHYSNLWTNITKLQLLKIRYTITLDLWRYLVQKFVFGYLIYVAGNCRNQAFPEMPSHFRKWLEFPQLPRHLQKRINGIFYIKMWNSGKKQNPKKYNFKTKLS